MRLERFCGILDRVGENPRPTSNGNETKMKRTLHNLDELKKNMFAAAPVKKPEPPPKPESPTLSSDDAYVLEYFSRDKKTPQNTTARRSRRDEDAKKEIVPEIGELEARVAVAEQRAKTLEETVAAAERRASSAEAALRAAEAKLSSAASEQMRLQSECARLSAELSAARDAVAAEPPPSRTDVPPSPLLASPAFREVFPGELREQLLAALADSADDAARNGRERRAAALASILAENRPTGELEARRAAIRQILKDAGAYTDAQAIARLEKLGFRLISGKKHWKLEYADIRFPLSKTPSDHRAHLNTTTDISNRCF